MDLVLQKFIADSGLASRRAAERLIVDGRVKVNGKIASLGQRVSSKDEVIVAGKKVKPAPDKVYLLLNKPVGYTCTNRYFLGEKNVFSLLRNNQDRLFVVGRLDKDSHGLVLLTNDGPLTQTLTHPRYEIKKTYRVRIDKEILVADQPEIVSRLKNGIDIGEGDGLAKVESAKFLDNRKLEIILAQGKKRQIRRLLGKLELRVVDLERISLKNLSLGDLADGQNRSLNNLEIEQLKK